MVTTPLRMVTTGASKSAFSFKSQAGTLSGPEALAGLRTQNYVTIGASVCCTATEIPGSNGLKIFIGARKALLMTLARAARLETGLETICFKTEVGSVRIANCILPSGIVIRTLSLH